MGQADLKAQRLTVTDSVTEQVARYRRKIVIQKNAGAATVEIYGNPTAPTLTATASNQDTNTRAALRHATSTVNANASGMISTAFTILRSQWNAEFSTAILSDVTDGYRMVTGFFSASPDAVDFINGAAPATQFMGFATDNPTTGGPSNFRWSWVCVTCDGLTIRRTPTFIATNVGNSFHKLRAIRGSFDKDGLLTTGCRFYVDETLITTHWDSLPTATLGYGSRITNTSAASHLFEWSRFEINHDG